MNSNPLTRRSFVGQSAAVVGGAVLAGGFPAILRGAIEDKKLSIALVGCGGRGSGAANQALTADSNCMLTAVADIFPEQADNAVKNLRANHPEKVSEKVQKFIGLDALDKVLGTDVDVVLLTTPPGFRPEHFEKAVQAGKHTFCEKPCATDAAGYRRFMAAAKLSKEKKLGVQSGFCWRAHYMERETYQRVLAGEIGDVRVAYGTYLGGTPWVKKRQPGWSDLEYQLRNWMYFTWLSGDHLVEQAIHSVDKMCWAFGDVAPISAHGMGGRQQRVEEEYGHAWDHFSIVYEYPKSARGFIMCRQQQGCWGDVSDHVYGTKGTLRKTSGRMSVMIPTEGEQWKYDGPKNDMYQTEHDEFFQSLRAGQPLNFSEQLAHSSMVGILGRMAAYTGQVVLWEDAIKAKESLAPKEPLDWDMKLSTPEVPIPGRTKIV